MPFQPDYRHILDAARNIPAKRLPLYEHIVSDEIIEQMLGENFRDSLFTDPDRYFRAYCSFFPQNGYDTVSFEACVSSIFPGGGALGGHKKGVIGDWESFERYPWDGLEERFFATYRPLLEALRRNMPENMRAIGGVGNGVFECVQDLVGYMDLCYLLTDEPELCEALFQKVGDVMFAIWRRFLDEFGDIYCVCRFGDDMGFKSATLLSANDIRRLIVPQYKRVIDLVHAAGKPFLLHSCGNIFAVMEDLIAAGIDAKHSNEDQIAPFPVWVERYGTRIGNFGGLDLDVVIRQEPEEIRRQVREILDKVAGQGGIAFGTGNSIPNYISVSGYRAMVDAVREYRGDFA